MVCHLVPSRPASTRTMSAPLFRALLLGAVAVASAQGEEPGTGSVPAEAERAAPAASGELPEEQASPIDPVLVASVLLPLLIAAFFLLRGGGGSGGNKVVLFGPMGGGKTSMYLHLRFGRVIPSHTSMQLTSATFAPKCEGASGSDKPITVVDVPGEPRLNYQLLARSNRLKSRPRSLSWWQRPRQAGPEAAFDRAERPALTHARAQHILRGRAAWAASRHCCRPRWPYCCAVLSDTPTSLPLPTTTHLPSRSPSAFPPSPSPPPWRTIGGALECVGARVRARCDEAAHPR